MTYRLIEDYSCSFTGGPMDPKGFAIHWWGDPTQNPTFMGTVNVLLARSEQQSASVNFVAEAGIVACLIDPFTIAWAQGDGANGWGNNNLVSIECNPRCTAGDRETVAELIADQHIRNGIPIVLYPHKNFVATQCPGVWEQWIPWLTSRAKQIVIEKTQPQSEVKKEWDEMASREDIKAAVREVLNEEFDIVDPTGATKNVTGKSTLIKKARWEAYLWAKNEEKLNQILDKISPVKPTE